MVMAFGLFGCSPSDNEDKNNDVEIENITDFSKFSTMYLFNICNLEE